MLLNCLVDADRTDTADFGRLASAAHRQAGLLREVAAEVNVWNFSDRLVLVPSRRGFELRDAIAVSQPHEGHTARTRAPRVPRQL